jgi:uncharacterized protein YdhG (YjbR/CyaY superfamily)
MNPEIISYNEKQISSDQEICNLLAKLIIQELPEADYKIWHAHPVWFLNGNPIVGYSKQKEGIKLMFWSGADFSEEKLKPGSGKFKDASIRLSSLQDIELVELVRWLEKSRIIQWDYKNIVKRKGVLIKIE